MIIAPAVQLIVSVVYITCVCCRRNGICCTNANSYFVIAVQLSSIYTDSEGGWEEEEGWGGGGGAPVTPPFL